MQASMAGWDAQRPAKTAIDHYSLGKDNQRLTVVELPSNVNPTAFKNKMKAKDFEEVEEDIPRYPVPGMEDVIYQTRKLAEETPWGMQKVFGATSLVLTNLL